MELQNNRVLTYCPPNFPAQYEILRAFRYCKRVTLQGYYAVSDILLSLAFANQWNSKHSSYVSTRLFCNSDCSASIQLYVAPAFWCSADVPCSVVPVFRCSGMPLQLPVFFLFLFFCQRYPEYRRIRSIKLFYRPPKS